MNECNVIELSEVKDDQYNDKDVNKDLNPVQDLAALGLINSIFVRLSLLLNLILFEFSGNI